MMMVARQVKWTIASTLCLSSLPALCLLPLVGSVLVLGPADCRVKLGFSQSCGGGKCFRVERGGEGAEGAEGAGGE